MPLLLAPSRPLPIPGSAWPQQRRSGAVLAAVVLVHGALLMAWLLAGHSLRRDAAPPHARMVWVATAAQPEPTPDAAPAAQAKREPASQRPAAGRPPATPKRYAPPSTITVPAAQEVLEAPVTAAAEAAPTAASAPPASIMQTAGTLAAIKNAASAPLLSERHQAVTGLKPITAAERFAKAASAAAHEDCMKTGGGGMGLFTIPALIYKVATDKCAQ